MIKLYITDLDGTLIDTCEANFKAYVSSAKHFGYDFRQDITQFRTRSFGYHYSEFLRAAVPEASEEDREKIAMHKTMIYPNYFADTKINYPLIEFLKSQKSEAKIALCSSARKKNVEALLSHFNLSNFFDLLITRDEVKSVKPSPECYTATLNHFNIPHENTLIFEDSEAGFLAASAANIAYLPIKIP